MGRYKGRNVKKNEKPKIFVFWAKCGCGFFANPDCRALQFQPSIPNIAEKAVRGQNTEWREGEGAALESLLLLMLLARRKNFDASFIIHTRIPYCRFY